ncbi:MAG: DUF86 domain-containing protein [Chloroflexi bacterium]|nr:MAG: DUF86 domain-containing protein [Chloroflexota bacterium]
MRRDEQRTEDYLRDIVQFVGEIEDLCAGVTTEMFISTDVIRSAVLLKLLWIGEAANHIPSDIQTRYPQVPWGRVVAFRNLAIHRYFGISWTRVWDAATVDAPALRAEMKRILTAEFPEEPERAV